MKQCYFCKEMKDYIYFHKDRTQNDGYCSGCIECKREIQRVNHKKVRKSGRYSEFKRKIKILTHYGLSCAGCGMKDIRLLCIDHINGNGVKHRKEIGQSSFYLWLIKNNFPEGFQTLCCNCNNLKKYENKEFSYKDKSVVGINEFCKEYMEANKKLEQEYVIEPWSFC